MKSLLWLLLYPVSALATDPPISRTVDLLKPLLNANTSLNAATDADMSCNCVINGVENLVSFENAASCGQERMYLSPAISAFKKADPKKYFTAPRAYTGGDSKVPPKCLLFVMRTALRDMPRTPEQKKAEDEAAGMSVEDIAAKTYSPDASQFATCPDSSGQPQRVGGKPCVTRDYFTLAYNALEDVSDCLDVPMDFALPKFANESGLHVNAFGPVNDGGIGQFTTQSLDDIAQNYPQFKGRVSKSEKPSCQRIRSIPGALPGSADEILSADSQRCHVMSMPPNPLRSLVYYGLFYHATKRNVRNAWARSDENNPADKNADELLDDLGFKLDRDKVQEMLFMMAYNAGPRPPITAFKEWLRYRAARDPKGKIKSADFNFGFWPPKGTGALDKATEALVREKAAAEGWDDQTTKDEISKAKAKARIGHLGATKRALTLPEYLYVYRNNIYVSAVKAQANKLDSSFGEGVCTPDKYLQL